MTKIAVCPPHAFRDNVCFVCGTTWVDSVKGFGIGGFTTKSRKGTSDGAKRLKGALSGE